MQDKKRVQKSYGGNKGKNARSKAGRSRAKRRRRQRLVRRCVLIGGVLLAVLLLAGAGAAVWRLRGNNAGEAENGTEVSESGAAENVDDSSTAETADDRETENPVVQSGADSETGGSTADAVTGGSTADAATDSGTAEVGADNGTAENAVVTASSASAQLQVMAEQAELWKGDPDFAEEVYQYAVTDLDHNGRYEIIVSNMGGTGQYTYSRFFEINESYDGLTECETDFVEGDSQPDLMTAYLDAFVDDDGTYFYAAKDLLKNGAAEYYENVRSLCLEGGRIITAPIAYRATIYEGETPTVTCTDKDGNEITEEAYDGAAESYFAGYRHEVTALGWQDVRELSGDAAGIAAQLETSLNVFETGQ